MNARLWLAAALCLGLSLLPWGPLLLYPFTLFTTWIHECSHAVMVVLTDFLVGVLSAIVLYALLHRFFDRGRGDRPT